MPSKNRLRITADITLKKIGSAKSNYVLGVLFITILAYVWIKDTSVAALEFFLLLFPYLFLILTQDMVRSEVESGSLENVVFIGGKFRSYLLKKNAIIVLTGGLISLIMFIVLILVSFFSHSIDMADYVGFGAGIVAGIYYTSLGGFLSFFLKGGANVLSVFLSQAGLAVSMIASAGTNMGFVNALSSGSLPDFLTQLKFAALAALFPNIVVSKKFLPWTIEPAVLSLFFFWLQSRRAARLELKNN